MDEKEKVTNEAKKDNEKVKSKNAVVLLIVLAVALIAIITLVILQVKAHKPEIGGQDNTKLNVEDKEQNVNDDEEVNVYQEKLEDTEGKEEPKEEVESKEESKNKNEEVNTESKKPQKEEQKVEVDFDELAKELYNKEAVKDLPKLTAEERVSYQKEWDESVNEMIKENEKHIKKKYPTLSDSEVRKYATQFTEYIKEDMFRILKHNREIIEDAKDAVETADKADAMAELSLRYAEVLSNHYQTNPGQSYKVNEQDLKTLQQHVLEESDGKYTVKIKEDNSGYDVVKVAN